MKINVCDICLAETEQLVESAKVTRIKGEPRFKLHLCETCFKTKLPERNDLETYRELVAKVKGWNAPIEVNISKVKVDEAPEFKPLAKKCTEILNTLAAEDEAALEFK